MSNHENAIVTQKLIKLIDEHGDNNRYFMSDFDPIPALTVSRVFRTQIDRVRSDPRLKGITIRYVRRIGHEPAFVSVTGSLEIRPTDAKIAQAL